MSGKRAIGTYTKGHTREKWGLPAWMVEQNQRSKKPNSPRPHKAKARK